VVDKNLKAELNFNFEEIGLKFEPETIDLLKGLLKKLPKSRLSATEALNHPSFNILKVAIKNPDEDPQLESGGVQNNLKEFNEK
jgi:serine/threonine protein kinase